MNKGLIYDILSFILSGDKADCESLNVTGNGLFLC